MSGDQDYPIPISGFRSDEGRAEPANVSPVQPAELTEIGPAVHHRRYVRERVRLPEAGRLRRWLDRHRLPSLHRLATRASRGPESEESVAVIGLGRFGGQVAAALVRLGHEVLGIDTDPRVVQSWAGRLTHVAEADGTNEDALRQLGVPEFQRVVVGIGTRIEASVLTVVSLRHIGVAEVWGKAINPRHGRILASVGARHVVYPEAAMGDRVAHLITSRMLDFTEIDEGFALAKIRAPAEVIGRPLSELRLRAQYGVVVIGVRDPDGRFVYAEPETVIPPGGVIIVTGGAEEIQQFSAGT